MMPFEIFLADFENIEFFEGVFPLFLHCLQLWSFRGFLSFPSQCLRALLSASNNLTQTPLFTLKAISCSVLETPRVDITFELGLAANTSFSLGP